MKDFCNVWSDRDYAFEVTVSSWRDAIRTRAIFGWPFVRDVPHSPGLCSYVGASLIPTAWGLRAPRFSRGQVP